MMQYVLFICFENAEYIHIIQIGNKLKYDMFVFEYIFLKGGDRLEINTLSFQTSTVVRSGIFFFQKQLIINFNNVKVNGKFSISLNVLVI